MTTALLLLVLGMLIALAAHLGCKVAERRARDVYRELVGEEVASSAPDDAWNGVRPLVARWGCLVTVLEFIRGLGVVVAFGAGLYLVTGH
jgi:hypothetical protein